MIAILDADKEGFLRSTRSLIQIIGRAARHAEGQVIMYADKQTDSMKGAIEETNRRRDKQIAHNLKYNITPMTIQKEIHSSIHTMDDEILKLAKTKGKSSRSEIEQRVKEFEKLMREAAKTYDFERAAELRDIIFELKADIKA
jgi:excinuclease ABC subunit B